jgi:heme-degrading monooxygenase HmoA
VIVRIWRGFASAEKAPDYHRHVTQTVFPSLKDIAGHRGAHLLKREAGGRVEFLAVTLWDSMDAVRAFAGANPDVAVVEPAAVAALTEFDSFVRHFELAYGECS